MKVKSWRQDRQIVPDLSRDNPRKILELPQIPTTRFFDQLSFIGDEFVGCFVLETSAGLVLIECMWPTERHTKMIEDGIKELGLEVEDLKAIMITHGHGDHYGNSGYFHKKYGTEIYISENEYYLGKNHAILQMPIDFEASRFLNDGDKVTFGETTINVYSTPGHTPDCLSFIFPVTDEGRPHMAALWGGSGVPQDRAEKEKYLLSCDYFQSKCSEMNVDVEIATHPFLDNSEERFAICRNIVNGTANPFVIGKEAAARYQQMFKNLCLSSMK